ncbi:TetR/AcrR family transcriptional regulator [Nocardioides sp. NPDC059952]|uniref:TetR/AcrR family transcriptional regulator n=1 Tax=Nocardioides sp. NPDC059952 TaxID=3347014 RepID=UPI00365B3FB0
MTTAVAPRWRRLDPDERRDQILACAVRLFGERPYAAVSTTEIAAQAGVARGLLNHYFGTKRDLYLEAVRTMLFLPPPEEIGPVSGTIAERVDAAVGWLVNVIDTYGVVWLRYAGAGGADADVREILDEADNRAADRVLDVIGFAGTEAERAVAHATVRAFGGAVKAMAREIVEHRTISPEQARRQLGAALVAMLEEL